MRGLTPHFRSIGVLRAVAAGMVLCFHFLRGNQNFVTDVRIRDAAAPGWLGVPVFFIISGFVIPWSLRTAGYAPRDFPRFLLKRIARLEPPYLVSIAAVLFLGWLSALHPLYAGEPFRFDARLVLLHAGFLNAFFGEPWLNPVFWTLAVEFQYYLLVPFLYFPISSPDPRVRRAAMLALLLFSRFHPEWLVGIFRWLPAFALGFLVFQRVAGLVSRREYVAWCAVAAALTYSYHPLMPVLAALTVYLIPHEGFRSRAGEALGRISYSLYLLHVPVGGRVIRFGARFCANGFQRAGLILLAAGASVCAAAVLYRFVEKPAAALSKKISYRGRESRIEGFAAS